MAIVIEAKRVQVYTVQLEPEELIKCIIRPENISYFENDQLKRLADVLGSELEKRMAK